MKGHSEYHVTLGHRIFISVIRFWMPPVFLLMSLVISTCVHPLRLMTRREWRDKPPTRLVLVDEMVTAGLPLIYIYLADWKAEISYHFAMNLGLIVQRLQCGQTGSIVQNSNGRDLIEISVRTWKYGGTVTYTIPRQISSNQLICQATWLKSIFKGDDCTWLSLLQSITCGSNN